MALCRFVPSSLLVCSLNILSYVVTQARSRYDLYKQVFGFKFETVLIRYVENEDYDDSMPATGQMVHEHLKAAKCVLVAL